MAVDRSPPPPRGPRISLDIADAPTQRLYLFSALVLLSAWKLSEFLFPSASPAVDEFNWKLARWVVVDLAFVAAVAGLRVPRLDWGWKGRMATRALLLLVDWLLFGRWEFTASILLPTFLKTLLATYLSTAERTVRLSSILGPDEAHLGGQYTVHILAVSTAQLNPASACFCIPTSSSEPVLIPLILNNTAPSTLTYTLTSLADPPVSQSYTIPFTSLIRPSPALKATSDADEGLEDWALVLSPKPSPPAIHHRLPSAPSSPSDESSPLDLSPSQSLYYLPIKTTGLVQLSSVLDHDGVPVRIRRKREPSGEWESVRVLRCPQAGFATQEKEVHRCLNPSAPESLSLDLAVSGYEPLSVRWHEAIGVGKMRGRVEGKLEGIKRGEGFGDGVVRVPVNVSLAEAGRRTFFLDSVVDGCGNEVSYAAIDVDVGKDAVAVRGIEPVKKLLPGALGARDVVVHLPPEVAFAGECGRGEDVRLLKGGKASLELKLSGVDVEVEEERKARLAGLGGKGRRTPLWKLRVRFTPVSGKGWEREVETSEKTLQLQVDESGTYEVLSVRGKYCEGAVLVPSQCTVVFQPLPTLQTTFNPLLDVCNSEVGLVSTLHLTGAPPFVVYYDLSQLSPTVRTTRRSQRITHSREEIRLEPGPGEWEYRFVKIDDKFYTGVELPNEPQFFRRQTVQLVGGAQWKNAAAGKTVHSCDGETVSVEVELKGASPWEIEYSVVGHPTRVIRDITTSDYALEIDIPSQIAERGGQFSLSLESVKDGNGCRRPLAVPDLLVDVRRTKPTARFHGVGGARSVVIKEKDRTKIPLRLTGEGPWTITYLPPTPPSGTPLPPIEFVAKQANVDLNIVNPLPGVYKLLSVRDRFCPGEISDTDWTIATLPRPTLSLSADAGVVVKNGSIIRRAVCEGAVDRVGIDVHGKPPFTASYTLSKGSHQAQRLSRTHQAIQSHSDLELFTGEPGHHTYSFTGIGDSLYTTPEPAGLVAPSQGRAGVVRLEQDVFAIPSASFRHGSKSGFCVRDNLISRHADDLIIELQGQPPFEIELEVREEGHRTSEKFTISDIEAHEWAVSLPFAFNTPSAHSVAISRVSDAHSCERTIDRAAPGALVTVPVAEIASIAPVLPQMDHCVGDFLEYELQGSPPFTVTYEFEGKRHAVPLSSSRFSRVAATPGLFKIVSVGHGQDQCKSNEVGLVKRIYPIPSAQVSEGKAIVVDIREGDQTEIVFTFTGEPPFAFTYSRRYPQDRSKDRTALETHTVAGIMEHKYSIFTSQEGTWTVSSIADKHCSIRKAP